MNLFKLGRYCGLFLIFQITIANAEIGNPELRDRVLNERVETFTQYQLNALKACDQETFNSLEASLNNTDDDPFRTISLWKSAYKRSCHQEIRTELNKLWHKENHIFRQAVQVASGLCLSNPLLYPSCHQELRKLLRELNPHCASTVFPTTSGRIESNPCFAGDYLIAKTLRNENDLYQENLTTFMLAFYSKVQSLPNGSNLDLLELYKSQNFENSEYAKHFFAMLAFFYVSATTHVGHIDGFGDYYLWHSYREGKSSEFIYNEYVELKRKKDYFTNYLRYSRNKNIKLSIEDLDVTHFSRHDFMAMFLGCHYQNQSEIYAHYLPYALGIVYESLDFYSHITSGVSLRRSLENFRVDTDRYKNGSQFGAQFCKERKR